KKAQQPAGPLPASSIYQMNYFELKYQRKKSIVGNGYNQIDLPDGYKYDSVGSICQIDKENYKNYNLNIKELALANGVRKTDFLSQVFINKGLVLSENAKNYLLDLKLPDHTVFPIAIFDGHQHSNYFLLYISFDILDYTIFEESSFYTVDGLRQKSQFTITSKEQYTNLSEQVKKSYEGSQKLHDSLGFPSIGKSNQIIEQGRNSISRFGYSQLSLASSLNYDIVYDYSSIYVSEHFKDLITHNGLTGVDFDKPKRIKIASR
ncbi:hypothetical protein, partial [Xanthovirga aplysinae]|uniref:hypothetical protein n=1 Tax=Xanthovirga aplysinae TaxID=2529853 RepID=UPI001656F6F2